MTVKAILWTYEPTKNGYCDIKIYVSNNKKKKYYSTGIQVHPDSWDKEKQKIKSHPFKKRFNQEIESIKNRFGKLLLDGVPADQLLEKQASKDLLPFLRSFIAEIEAGLHKIKASSCKNYKVLLRRLEAYCQDQGQDDLSFDDIDLSFYASYYQFVLNNGGGRAGFGNHIKLLKKIMKVAQQRDLHQNIIYQHEDFRAIKESAGDKIYLTTSEIEQIAQLDLKTMPHLDKERDRFLISYYFIMRWEDSTLIKPSWVKGEDYIAYTAKKTGVRCTIPVAPAAKLILDKRHYNFAGSTNQEANRKLKTIGSLAGINQVVQQNGIEAPKFQFITSHTARRSAATNMYLESVPLGDIMKLGGWKKLQTLQIYLRASGFDVAQNAKRYSFFQQ